MTDKEFWGHVESVGWGQQGTPYGDRLKKALMDRLGSREIALEFGKLYRQKHKELSTAFDAWEKKHESDQLPLSDDSYSDFINHILGLGEKVYSKALAAPGAFKEMAEKREFVESFAYVLPYTYTEEVRVTALAAGDDVYDDFDLLTDEGYAHFERSLQGLLRAREVNTIEAFFEALADNIAPVKMREIIPFQDRIVSVVRALQNKEWEKAVRLYREMFPKSRYERVFDSIGNGLIPNWINDLESFRI